MLHYRNGRKALLALLTALAMAATAFAKTNGGEIQRQQVEVGSNLALMAANHIYQAQTDLRSNEIQKARDQLIKANTVLDVMKDQAAVPKVRSRLTLADKQLSRETPQAKEVDLVPIYADLNVITEENNNRQARKHLDKAINKLKKGDREAARNELRQIDKLIVYQQISIPIKSTQSNLEDAIAALGRKDVEQAKKSIEAATTAVQEDIVAVYDREGKREAGGMSR